MDLIDYLEIVLFMTVLSALWGFISGFFWAMADDIQKLHLSANGWANFLFFQWLWVRRVKVTDLATGEVTFEWIKVIPLTGWWSKYIPWGGDESKYISWGGD